mmetsp:Transcript_59254/g.158584  ORF Transcript_59254/g.158584 Transcript_59254/m.158584 type:complete len:303 (+) Transcript_59254:55-963(+)
MSAHTLKTTSLMLCTITAEPALSKLFIWDARHHRVQILHGLQRSFAHLGLRIRRRHLRHLHRVSHGLRLLAPADRHHSGLHQHHFRLGHGADLSVEAVACLLQVLEAHAVELDLLAERIVQGPAYRCLGPGLIHANHASRGATPGILDTVGLLLQLPLCLPRPLRARRIHSLSSSAWVRRRSRSRSRCCWASSSCLCCCWACARRWAVPSASSCASFCSACSSAKRRAVSFSAPTRSSSSCRIWSPRCRRRSQYASFSLINSLLLWPMTLPSARIRDTSASNALISACFFAMAARWVSSCTL